MPRTLTQLKSRLAQAMAEADDAEAVLELVREAVRRYDFEEADVFPAPPKLVLVESPHPNRARTVGGTPQGNIPHPPYEDGMGNVWSGKGRRPNWLLEALENGASLEDLMPKSRLAKPKRPAKSLRSSNKLQAPYADDVGNTWSGKGRRPNWLVEALALGMPLERFSTAKPVKLTKIPAGEPKSRRGLPKTPYADADGNTWAGKGRRPNWLTAAIESGASLDDFSTGR